MEKSFRPAVYIITNQQNGTLYIGVTSNLVQRIWQHKQQEAKGFASQYGLTQLVYMEWFETMEKAIAREKQLKKWKRQWKLELIECKNPSWQDLWFEIIA